MTLEEIADQALGLFRTQGEMEQLDRALADALSGRLSEAELNLEWRRGNSQMWFESSPRFFIEMAQRKLMDRLKEARQ